jgi:tRNA-specific 2-thiouridylase
VRRKRIIVGLSGGVDSAVAALLLTRAGHEVRAIYMKNWTESFGGACPWREDRRMAVRVAAKIGIPFATWNFEREYRDRVMEYFFAEYTRGRTPNPDVLCNREIKFAAFLDAALAQGADAVATGHYAKVSSGADGPELHMPRDRNKDQTYFLSFTDPLRLGHAVFPLADYLKADVRRLAAEADLPNAQRPDSQGICFVGEVPIREFLKTRIAPQKGAIRSADGETLGAHEGIAYYTIGQRTGLNVSGDGVPLYVAAKDARENTLTVVQGRNAPELFSKTAAAHDMQWFGAAPRPGAVFTARLRYRQEPAPCTVVSASPSRVAVRFAQPQRAVTPGQFLVLYDGTRVAGSGILDDAHVR